MLFPSRWSGLPVIIINKAFVCFVCSPLCAWSGDKPYSLIFCKASIKKIFPSASLHNTITFCCFSASYIAFLCPSYTDKGIRLVYKVAMKRNMLTSYVFRRNDTLHFFLAARGERRNTTNKKTSHFERKIDPYIPLKFGIWMKIYTQIHRKVGKIYENCCGLCDMIFRDYLRECCCCWFPEAGVHTYVST